MSVVCKICKNPLRQDIDGALVAGGSVRRVAARFRLPKSSLHDHMTNCLKTLLADRAVLRDQRHGDKLLDKLEELLTESSDIVRRAKRDGNDVLVLRAISESRDTLRMIGEFTGVKAEPPPRVQTNYQIIFQNGRPIMQKVDESEAIELPALAGPKDTVQ
jgi:hypothetical protein